MFDLNNSPIRKNLLGLKQGELSIFEDDNLFKNNKNNINKFRMKTILKDIENMLAISENNKNTTVKIAVMGELNAGKSTFVNACAKKEIAYTDILEATALVSEITYSEQQYAHILDKKGNIVHDFTFEELVEWYEKQQDKQLDDDKAYEQYEKICLGVNSEFFKDIIFVDTPGLLSIRSENHDITNKYVAETDYILWVLDSTTLGSKAVNNVIQNVKQSGKPIIGVINKVDDPETENEIRDYIKTQYEGTFEQIFFISALNIWEEIETYGCCKDDIFNELVDCIEDLKYDKQHSENQTEVYQLNKELEVHQRVYATISSRKECFDGEMEAFADINRKIKNSVNNEFNSWIANKFFTYEKNHLLNLEYEEFIKTYEKFKSNEYISKIITDKYNEITLFICDKWEIVEKSSLINSSQVFTDFSYERTTYKSVSDKNTNNEQIITESAKQGFKAGAGVGIALAGYAAWLGPAANMISFVSVVAPYTIPLAIIGAGIGAYVTSKTVNFSEIEQNAIIKREIVQDLYMQMKQYVNTVIKNELFSKLTSICDYYYNERCKMYRDKVKQLNFDFDEPNYSQFINKLKKYILSIEQYLSLIENNDLITPPDTISK